MVCLWLATEQGLLRFDPKTGAFSGYTTREGLPDNVVQCILGDKSGNLWLSTNNGLSRFNPNDNTFVNFHESDGLQGEQFNRKACFVDASGIMYFGGLRGFNMFDPSRIPAKPEGAGRVVLTEFRILGKTVPVRPDSVFRSRYGSWMSLNLSHKDEEFSFEFAALNFSDQSRTRIVSNWKTWSPNGPRWTAGTAPRAIPEFRRGTIDFEYRLPQTARLERTRNFDSDVDRPALVDVVVESGWSDC